jgi:thiol-disulfide isomerase/thioredoxin
MKRIMIIALIGVLALVAGAITRYWLLAPPSVPKVQEPVLVDLDGRSHHLSEWQGKVLVLNFWATWCPPCRDEMPGFAQLQNELGNKGLQFVGVAIDEPTEVRAFLQRHPVNYPVLIGDDTTPAWADSLGNEMSALPFSVVFGRDGKILHSQIGVFKREQVLDIVGPELAR